MEQNTNASTVVTNGTLSSDLPINGFTTPAKKIYKEKGIYFGTLLGGPLVGAYLMAENFKTFNDPQKAKHTWIYAISIFVFALAVSFLVPENIRFPKFIFPALYFVIAQYGLKKFQQQDITVFTDAGAEVYSWWQVIKVTFIGLLITLIPIFGIGMIIGVAETINTDNNIESYQIISDVDSVNDISDAEMHKILNELDSAKADSIQR